MSGRAEIKLIVEGGDDARFYRPLLRRKQALGQARGLVVERWSTMGKRQFGVPIHHGLDQARRLELLIDKSRRRNIRGVVAISDADPGKPTEHLAKEVRDLPEQIKGIPIARGLPDPSVEAWAMADTQRFKKILASPPPSGAQMRKVDLKEEFRRLCKERSLKPGVALDQIAQCARWKALCENLSFSRFARDLTAHIGHCRMVDHVVSIA